MSKIEERVAKAILSRSEEGLKKYGVTVERTDLTVLEWLKHAQEEAMDFAVYLERLKVIHEDLETIFSEIMYLADLDKNKEIVSLINSAQITLNGTKEQ